MNRIYFSLLAASVATLTACGAGAVGLNPLQSAQQNARPGGNLLYVSDTDTSDAYVYTYPSGKLKQKLGFFRDPGGECADAKGDVFVTNTGDEDVVEFAHGGKRPIQSLEDTGYFPIGCAVDPTTGNLAVTNFSSAYSSGAGEVAIYEHAAGKVKKHYADSAIPGMLLCAYDGSGNLFVDGFTSGSSGFAFAELPKGGTQLVNVTLNQSISTAGGVAWDGKYVVVGDQAANAVYRFKISGSSGTKVGTTSLSGGSAIFQFTIFDKQLIGPNSAGGDVKIWKYPAGGSAIQTISGLYAPLGTAISQAP